MTVVDNVSLIAILAVAFLGILASIFLAMKLSSAKIEIDRHKNALGRMQESNRFYRRARSNERSGYIQRIGSLNIELIETKEKLSKYKMLVDWMSLSKCQSIWEGKEDE